MAETIIPLSAFPPNWVPLAEIRSIARWIVNAAITLFVIAYLTSFILILAEHGRDIQSLVLNGARQTLFLAFFGMLARIFIGFLLGIMAGSSRLTYVCR
jgi:ABC-type dipeptide/oligopeptide/nickel transport system permease subunit